MIYLLVYVLGALIGSFLRGWQTQLGARLWLMLVGLPAVIAVIALLWQGVWTVGSWIGG